MSLMICPLSLISNQSGNIMYCETENCVFWEGNTCVMKIFFLGLIPNDPPPENREVV